MRSKQLILDLHSELIVDNFAGGGGASTGIEIALGRHVDHAINHDRFALGMHRINHPQTVHHCEDVFDVDPATICEGRPVGLAHFSPDCKHFSKAKGGKPVDKRIRGLVLVMLRWAKYGVRVMTMENVEEIKTWGPTKRMFKNGKWGEYPDPDHQGRTWKAFLSILSAGIRADHPDLPEILSVLDGTVTKEECVRGFGYVYEVREIRAFVHGTPTIRKRCYAVFRRDGKPIIWPEQTHADPADHNRNRKLKPWNIIGDCLDWSLPCPSIFLTREEARRAKCKRPLARTTLRRVALGIDRHVLKAKRPFLVNLTHQGGYRIESIDEPARTLTGARRGEKALVCPIITEHANSSNQRNMPANEPMRTQCASTKGGHFALVAGSMVQTGYGEREGQNPRALDPQKPLGTVVAGACKHALIAAPMVKLHGTNVGNSANRPCDTIIAGGQHHGVIAAHLTKFNTGSIGQDLDRPAPTVTAGSHGPDTHGGAASSQGIVVASLIRHFGKSIGQEVTAPAPTTVAGGGGKTGVVASSLVAYYGNDRDGQGLDEAARTVTTKECFGLLQAPVVAGPTPEQLAGARRVAAFLREFGVEFEGEFAAFDGYIIVDIGMRMLTPRELFRAQGFPKKYVIDRALVIDPKTGDLEEILLTKEQQIRMCGNSVCPPVMAVIVRANVPELAISEKNKRATAQFLMEKRQ
jgi:DNA (cytosine-5)-methyltransferase 1